MSVQPTLFEFLQGKQPRQEQITEQTGPHGRILQGHVLDVLRTVPSGSVHCVVTSPPYWGLRDYKLEPQIWDADATCRHEWSENWTSKLQVYKTETGRKYREEMDIMESTRTSESRHQGDECDRCGAWRGSLGFEPTPELYVQHLVQVFREVKRVLRSDGTVWLNIGDTYASGWSCARRSVVGQGSCDRENNRLHGSLKDKDLVGIPWLVAFALRADGWWLHADIILSKKNPTPESVQKRPTKSHEYLFLFSKNGETLFWTHPFKTGTRTKPSADYRWVHIDTHEEVAEAPAAWLEWYNSRHADGRHHLNPTKWRRINLWRGHDYYYDGYAIREPSSDRPNGNKERKYRRDFGGTEGNRGHQGFSVPWFPSGFGKNRRSVWTITTASYKGAHFAVFSTELVEPVVLAGSSAKGCCVKCGAPYTRTVKTQQIPTRNLPKMHEPKVQALGDDHAGAGFRYSRAISDKKTTGWEATCECVANIRPCVVLDPFLGSGTTAIVAENLGRDWIGIELNPQYVELAKQRLREESNRPLIPISETRESPKLPYPLETD